jgi:hypothetical protein
VEGLLGQVVELRCHCLSQLQQEQQEPRHLLERAAWLGLC